MPQPSKPALQSIRALHGFPIALQFNNPFKNANHQLCVKSSLLVTTEFPHYISKNNDVPHVINLKNIYHAKVIK
ncbi:MAG: hypothetical protein WC799_23490 [Desulfobacteraceae bacterium]|jgi:hypothetical protein